MSVQNIYLISLTLFAVVIGTENEAQQILKSLTAFPPATVALWSIPSGMLGGFAMQLIGDKVKSRKQFSGEILLSGIAGLCTGAFGAEYFSDIVKLGAASCLAGAGGSGFIVGLVKIGQTKLGAIVEAIFGIKHDK